MEMRMGDEATQVTGPVWAIKFLTSVRDAAFQIWINPSA